MNIAVFLPNWIGDVVMATPAVRALRRHFPEAHILGVHRSNVDGLLQGAPWFDGHVHLDISGSWSKRWPAAAMRLRRAKIDLAILFPNSFHTAMTARLGGCRRRVGYRRYGRGWLLTDALDPVRDEQGHIMPSPIIDGYNRLVEEIGCPPPGHDMEVFTTALDEQAVDNVWEKCQLHDYPEVVCLNPGAAFGASKFWPIEYFVQLAQDIADLRGSGVLVLCGPAERELARQIAARAARQSVHSLADQPLSLGLTKACVRRAHVLVTTDSGPRHFAAAFNRPVVTLFGPTHIAWTETFFAKAVHLQKKVDCGPCQLRVCPLDHRCMKQLTPGEVFGAMQNLLAGIQRKAS